MHQALWLGYAALYPVVLAGSWPATRRAHRSRRRDAEAVVMLQGRVVEVTSEWSSGSDDATLKHRLRVAYWGPGGEVLESVTQDRHTFGSPPPGTAVPVWVDPAAPGRVWWRPPTRAAAFAPYALTFGLAGVAWVFGAGFLAVFG